jgi:Secretion system C-terminal sorting domain
MKKALLTTGIVIGLTISGWSQWTHNWSRTMGGPLASTGAEAGKCITQGTGNNTFSISAGTFTGTFDADPGSGVFNLVAAGGSIDMYIIRLDNSGAFVWARQVSGLGTEIPESIKLSADELSVYVCGRFSGLANFNLLGGPAVNKLSVGSDDIFIGRYSATTGNTAAAGIITFGSIGNDDAWDLDIEPSGNILVSGSFSNTIDFDPSAAPNNRVSNGLRDVFIAQYPPNLASLIWVRTWGGTGDDIGYGICFGQGAVYVCGVFQNTVDFDAGGGVGLPSFNLSAIGLSDLFFCKYILSTGAFGGWSRQAGTLANAQEAKDIAFSSQTGAIYITGNLRGPTITFPTGGPAYVIAGLSDLFLICYNSAGNYLWGTGIGGTGIDFGLDICTDLVSNASSNGYVYLCGVFSTTVNFDFLLSAPGSKTSAGGRDAFMLRYNTTGLFKDVASFGSTGVDECAGIIAGTTNQFTYITGSFTGVVDFDPGVGFANRTSAVGTDLFHNRYSWTAPLRLANPDLLNTTSSSIYPNPTSSTLFIENLEDGTSAEIYSMNGEKVASENAIGTDRLSFDLSQLANGMYLVRIIKTDGSVENNRIVVQH